MTHLSQVSEVDQGKLHLTREIAWVKRGFRR